MHGQAYLAETSIGQKLYDGDRVKIVCKREAGRYFVVGRLDFERRLPGGRGPSRLAPPRLPPRRFPHLPRRVGIHGGDAEADEQVRPGRGGMNAVSGPAAMIATLARASLRADRKAALVRLPRGAGSVRAARRS